MSFAPPRAHSPVRGNLARSSKIPRGSLRSLPGGVKKYRFLCLSPSCNGLALFAFWQLLVITNSGLWESPQRVSESPRSKFVVSGSLFWGFQQRVCWLPHRLLRSCRWNITENFAAFASKEVRITGRKLSFRKLWCCQFCRWYLCAPLPVWLTQVWQLLIV